MRASWRAPIPLLYGSNGSSEAEEGQDEGAVRVEGRRGRGCNRRIKDLNWGSRRKIGLRWKAPVRLAFRVIELVAVAGAKDPHQAPRVPEQVSAALADPLEAVHPGQKPGILERLDRLGDG